MNTDDMQWLERAGRMRVRCMYVETLKKNIKYGIEKSFGYNSSVRRCEAS